MPSGRLRVLFVQGAGIRAGAERALMARLRHLPEHGIEPTVAFLSGGPFRDEVEAAGVPTIRLAEVSQLRRAGRSVASVRGLADLTRERADVIEGCGEKMSVLAGWSARFARRPCVFNLQDGPARDPRATAVQLAAAAGRHDAVVVPSSWMARQFPSSWRLAPTVIPNALVLEDLPQRGSDIRGHAGWAAETPVIGLFGRLVRWKGAEVLVRAAAALADRNPDLRFVLAGGTLYGLEPDFSDQVHALARDLGVEDRILMTGHREDALELMLDCDVICHCSLEPEPFGMVVVEAMALGKPVIATRTGGPEEVIEHLRTGILVDPGDPGALASAMAELMADPGRRRTLGEAAQRDVEARFSSQAVAGPLAALYRRLAPPRPA